MSDDRPGGRPRREGRMGPDDGLAGGRRPESAATYCLAARFAGEADAGVAYGRAHDAIQAGPPCDLGGWRLQLAQVWHVVLLGDTPSAEVDARLRAALGTGELVTLSQSVQARLAERRARSRQQAPHVERHFWPGQPL